MRNDDTWLPVRLEATRDLTPDIREFRMRPAGGASGYPAGAHLRVRVMIGDRPDIRRYSLVGRHPVDGCWRIAVKREDPGRGGSRYLWSLPEGARLEVTPPDTFFGLSPDAPAYLLIAGGIGITPIRGMATTLRDRGATFRMIYGGRAREAMAYVEELEAELGDRFEAFAGADGPRLDLAAEFAQLAPDGEAYVCGPLGLLEAAKRAWAATGRPRARLIFETFGSSGQYAAEAFRVHVPRLGLDVEVPANRTLLEVLEGAGVGVLSDCRRGECGLCVVEILSHTGTIDHRDVFFSDHEHEEGRRLCACVSRVVGGEVSVDPAFRGDAQLKPGQEALKGSVFAKA